MPRTKFVCGNHIFKEVEKEENFLKYEKESTSTVVIYQIQNIADEKSYIGYASSYEKHGDKDPSRYGGIGRFRRHWSNHLNPDKNRECPEFYNALKDTEPYEWFVYTLKVLENNKKKIKKWEAFYIEKYKTHEPNFGYNILVSDSLSKKSSIDNKYVTDFKKRKEVGNRNRAKGGKLRKSENTVDLPTNINYRYDKDRNIIGYFAQIKIDDILYNRAFLSQQVSMEDRLKQAIEFIKNSKIKARKTKLNKQKIKSQKLKMGNPQPKI